MRQKGSLVTLVSPKDTSVSNAPQGLQDFSCGWIVIELKELPPEPSATAARWEATCSLDDYIQQASNAIAQTKARLSIFQEVALADSFKAERYKMEEAERLFYEARFQLLEPKYGLRNLFDKHNWASERPSVSLHATINQRGNFAVNWKSPAPDLLLSGGTREHYWA